VADSAETDRRIAGTEVINSLTRSKVDLVPRTAQQRSKTRRIADKSEHLRLLMRREGVSNLLRRFNKALGPFPLRRYLLACYLARCRAPFKYTA